MRVSNDIILSSYMEVRYSMIRFQLRFVYTQAILTPLHVRMTDILMIDSPQKEDRPPNELKANDGK